MTSNLFDVADLTTIGGFVGESVAQRSTNGMGGEVLHMGSQMQQLVFVEILWVYGSYSELSMSQRSRLVEHDGIDLCQHIHIVRALDQNTLSRCTSDTSEEGQRNTQHQSTRTAHDEEHQRTIEPSGEGASQQWGDNSDDQRSNDDNRGIDTCELRDECLALRLMLRSVLHEIDNLRDGTLAKALGGAHLDDARQVDTS